MIEFDAFHLPGFTARKHVAWQYLEYEGIRLRWPLLSPAQLEEICGHIACQRSAYLIDLPVSEIVAAVDGAAAILQSEIGEHASLISTITGYSRQIVAETLTHMFVDWRAPALETMLLAELGDARALDHPVRDPHIIDRQIAAYGFPLTLHIFSGNVPGVAVTSIVRSLLVKSATLGKTASGEPALAVLFARALQRAAPRLAECLAITYWPGGTATLDEAALAAAQAVVVYGGDHAVRAIASKMPPERRLVVHGARISFGVVGALAQFDTLALEVAHAVAAYDQQGCVSPHLIYVIGSTERARDFARAVSAQLAALATTHPRGRLRAGDAVAIRNARAAAEFGGAESDRTELFGVEPAAYSVIYEADPGFKASCLNRLLYVKPLPQAQDLAALLPENRYLQSVAIAGFADAEKAELIRLLGLAGVSRVTTFERLPWPPMHWHHDGSAPLRELLRWQDIER